MPKLASYNGKVDSIENIKVSPMSRAFLFSDSVYEVISFYKKKFIDFETHLDRLKHSQNETKISCSIEDCKTEIEKLLSESKSEDGYIYSKSQGELIPKDLTSLKKVIVKGLVLSKNFPFSISHL